MSEETLDDVLRKALGREVTKRETSESIETVIKKAVEEGREGIEQCRGIVAQKIVRQLEEKKRGKKAVTQKEA